MATNDSSAFALSEVMQPSALPRPGFPGKRTNQLQYMETVLDAMTATDYCFPFLEPVDLTYNPGYCDIVNSPMDLSTIGSRLRNNYYQNAQECIDDFHLFVNNALLYYSPGYDSHTAALILDEILTEKLTFIPRPEVELGTETLDRPSLDDADDWNSIPQPNSAPYSSTDSRQHSTTEREETDVASDDADGIQSGDGDPTARSLIDGMTVAEEDALLNDGEDERMRFELQLSQAFDRYCQPDGAVPSTSRYVHELSAEEEPPAKRIKQENYQSDPPSPHNVRPTAPQAHTRSQATAEIHSSRDLLSAHNGAVHDGQSSLSTTSIRTINGAADPTVENNAVINEVTVQAENAASQNQNGVGAQDGGNNHDVIDGVEHNYSVVPHDNSMRPHNGVRNGLAQNGGYLPRHDLSSTESLSSRRSMPEGRTGLWELVSTHPLHYAISPFISFYNDLEQREQLQALRRLYEALENIFTPKT